MKSFWKKTAIALSATALLMASCGDRSNPEANPLTKDWVEYSPEDGSYRVKFPGEPTQENDASIAYEEGDFKYAVGVIDFPPELDNIDEKIDQIMKLMAESGSTIEKQEDVTQNGLSGKKLAISAEETKVKVLMLVDKKSNKIYQALAGTEKAEASLDAPEIDAFIDSFEVTEVADEKAANDKTDSDKSSVEAPKSGLSDAIASEGKTMLGSMARAQQAYHLEKSAFATAADDLGLGIQLDGDRYKYAIVSANSDQTYMTATAQKAEAKSFAALVFLDKSGKMSKFILCETDEASQAPPAIPTVEGDEAECPAGSSKV